MTALMPENCWSRNRITPMRAPRKLSSSDRLTLDEWELAASGLPPAGCSGDRVNKTRDALSCRLWLVSASCL